MKPKRKRIVALLLLAAMAAAWIPTMVQAADAPSDPAPEPSEAAEPVPGPAIAPPEAPESEPEETPLVEETEPIQEESESSLELEPEPVVEPAETLEPLDVDLSSGRLLVDSGGTGIVGEDAPVLAEHDGIYLLQYETVEQAEAAYREYSETAKSVEADIPFSLADEEETPVPEEEAMTEDENPLTILEEQLEESEPVEEPSVIALIDSGTGVTENITDRYSVIDDDPSDNLGHGTSMLETIISENPEAQVISIKAFGETGKGTVSSVYAAIQLAIELQVDFINLSACARVTEESAVITRTIQDAVARGITFVGAAGNDGADVRDYIPGSIPEATIVGALDSSGSPASFSNYGDTVDYWKIADSTSVAAALMTGILSKGEEDPAEPDPETPEEPVPSEEPAEASDESNTAVIRNVLASAVFPDGEGLAYLAEHNEYSVSLFIVFCQDMIQHCEKAGSTMAISSALTRWKYWKEMFGNKKLAILDKMSIKGLIGELLELRDHFMEEYGIDAAVRSWMGPLFGHKDFEINDTWYEVKTVNENALQVTISSLEQLDSETDQ